MKVWSRTMPNVPKMLETYATRIPIEYITSIFKFLCLKPLIPAFKIGKETYKNGAILTIRDSSPIEDMFNFRRINEGCKLVVIPGADHQFKAPGVWDMVVDLTRDWFEWEQVLLCDWT